MIKRAMDLIVATAGLAILIPVLMVIGVAVKTTSPGPIFYRGERVGRGGRVFRILKFRTMHVGADRGPSSTADDDPRVTRVGAVLRRFKLDELPQLWNVLVGEMSLVGPRPQVRWAVAQYSDDERILLTVRPGITDPASLQFSNEGEILRGHPDPDRAYLELIHPVKMRLAIDYVRRQTIGGDLKIIFLTIAAVVSRRSSKTDVMSKEISA